MLKHTGPLHLWAKNRAIVPLLAVAAACVVFALVARNTVVEWPDIVGGSTLKVPLAALSPLALTVAQVVALHRIDPVAETRGLRPIWWLDLATSTLTMAGFLAVAAWFPDSEGAGVGARNALLLTGTALLVNTLTWRPIAAVAPTLWFLVSSVAGQSGGRLHLWAVPVWPPDPWTWIGSSALFAAGLAATGIRRRPLQTNQNH